MRRFHLKRNLKHCPTINIDRLWSLMPAGVLEKAEAGADQAPVLDVTKLVSTAFVLLSYCHSIPSWIHILIAMPSHLQGYFKVLGKGVLPKAPLVVKAKYFSKDVSTCA